MKTEKETNNLAVDLSGATEPMYVTYEQAIAISGYRDLVSLFTAGMERAKNERIMEGVESDQLRDEPTGAGFFEYYVRHLPNGPADFRQEMIVMYDFIHRIESMAKVSLFIQKLREHPDRDSLSPHACFFLRNRSLGNNDDADLENIKKTFDLYQEAGDTFDKEYPDLGYKLLCILKTRIVKFLNEVARQIHYTVNIVANLRTGGMSIRELRNAELALMDLCHQKDLCFALPYTDDILGVNSKSVGFHFDPLFDRGESAEEFPSPNEPFITELSTKASFASCKDLQRTGEEMEQFFENTAKKLWESYRDSVGGTAIDNAVLPDWETFRKDTAKKRQSEGWVAMAKTLIGDLSKTAIFATHYGQTETIPFLDCEFEIEGALAIPILLRYRNAALIPHDNPTGRVVIDDVTGSKGRTTFMVYDVEKKTKSVVSVTSDDYKHPFRVVRRDPAWSEFIFEFQDLLICKPGQVPPFENAGDPSSEEDNKLHMRVYNVKEGTKAVVDISGEVPRTVSTESLIKEPVVTSNEEVGDDK